MKQLKAPFPYFGGKSTIAPLVWELLGDTKMYIEPFFGSGAVLLNRPATTQKTNEIVNDKDGNIANLWRALQADPDAVAKVCDWPCNHADLCARKGFIISKQDAMTERLIADPDFYDVKMAGYWIWAASHWIGSGLTSPGQIPHLANDRGIGQIPHLTNDQGRRHVQDPYADHVYDWFRQLSERLRHVKVVCGEWTRVCGGNWQSKHTSCGIFFDPPYSATDRDTDVYAHDSTDVAHDVREWCIRRGNDPALRIVLAGYEDEHQDLLNHGWETRKWTAKGGFSRTGTRGATNAHRECLFISPYCLKTELF